MYAQRFLKFLVLLTLLPHIFNVVCFASENIASSYNEDDSYNATFKLDTGRPFDPFARFFEEEPTLITIPKEES